MTTETETAKPHVHAHSRSASLLLSIAITLVIVAGFAWVGGIALNKGFGVSVPFVAAWLLLLVGMSVVKTMAGQVADTWHSSRVKADINLLAASMAAQEAMQKQEASGLEGLLASLSKATKDDKDSGAYL